MRDRKTDGVLLVDKPAGITSHAVVDRARKARRFHKKLPIYNTEFGLQSNPPDRSVSTSLSRQAALINEKEEYAYRYSRLKSHSQYLMFDDPARSGGFRLRQRVQVGRPRGSIGLHHCAGSVPDLDVRGRAAIAHRRSPEPRQSAGANRTHRCG